MSRYGSTIDLVVRSAETLRLPSRFFSFLTRANEFLWRLQYANESLTHSLTHSLRCRHCRSGNKSSRARSSNHALNGRGFVIVYTRHCCFKYHLLSEQNLSSSGPNLKVRIASIVNSIIICRHWGLDQSVADHKKKLCARLIKENLWNSLPQIFNFNNSNKLAVTLNVFLGIFFLSDASKRKPSSSSSFFICLIYTTQKNLFTAVIARRRGDPGSHRAYGRATSLTLINKIKKKSCKCAARPIQ